MTARTPNVQPVLPSPPSRINAWWVRFPLLVMLWGMLTLLTLAVFFVGVQLRHAERIYPNVYALGVNLGGMTLEEAHSALDGRFSYGANTVFTFRDGDKFWQMTASELGVSFDLEATVQTAFDVGHGANLLTDINEQLQAWFRGVTVAPVITYHQQVALDQLNAIADSIYQAPQNATLSLSGTQVTTTQGKNGRALDVPTTLTRLENYILQMRNGSEIPLVINETPPIVYSVDSTAEQIQLALSGSVKLVATDEQGNALGPWEASVDQIASLLNVTLTPHADGTQSYKVSINMGAFEAFIQTLAPGLITPPRDGRFRFNEQSRQLEVIQPSISGRTLNVTETLKRLEEGVFSTNRIVPMAFDLTLPKYHNQVSATELGIQELVAESTTYFTGSGANRRTNIAVAASKFDGIIVAPGEEFSFNTFLGEISEEGGFVEGLVIYGDRTVIGIGGGACQVSTTIFRAAFTGGFAITERNSHGYRVGYYELGGSPPGLDAAIWQPERDFRFQNNTPHHLLIQVGVYPTNDALQFRFYSTKHWRTEIEPAIVKNETPALPARYEANASLREGELLQVDYAANGADVTVYRNIYDLNGNFLRKDYVYTHYLPWGAIYQVAPNDNRLSSGS